MILRSLEEVPFNPESIVTVGTFDGVHIAHQRLLSSLASRGKFEGLRSVVITFSPHPQEVLTGRRIDLLMTEEERFRTISNFGIDEVCVLNFDKNFSQITAEDFLLVLVRDRIGLREFVLGYNHTFGKGAKGTLDLARDLGHKNGFAVSSLDAVYVDGEIVSSSAIRKLLKRGNLAFANKMLGKPYHFEGVVVRGDGRGKGLGYPTANLKLIDDRLLVPALGVYIVEVDVEGQKHPGLMSIGVRPTFADGGHVTVEVWISNFEKDIYGKQIGVTCIHRLRDEMKFNSAQDLVKQMDNDRFLLNEYIKTTFNQQR